jgi:hypothetical protein
MDWALRDSSTLLAPTMSSEFMASKSAGGWMIASKLAEGGVTYGQAGVA